MKIKDYKCKCGGNDFFFADTGNQVGIYCSYCGKWFKWADKDEQNLRKTKPSILDRIKDEIGQMDFDFCDYYDHTDTIIDMVTEVIDKYKSECGE